MNNKLAYMTLRKELANVEITKYSVTQYCKAIGMGRGSFYSKYSGMADLFCSVLQFEIVLHFREYQDYELKKLVYALVNEIYQRRTYYLNIYNLVSKSNNPHICEHIRKAFFIELQTFLLDSDYSNKRIRSISNMSISHLISWVSHGCKESVMNIYTDLISTL